MKVINIYTDGACSGNQNKENVGGYGAILEYGSHKKELCGGERNTTNNRMEMKALIEALKVLKSNSYEIKVFSDSSYLMNCFRERWYEKWEKNNWISSKKTPVENRDLWEQLIFFVKEYKIHFFRVKGHVNLDSEKTNLQGLYKKFVEWNGASFTLEDFLYITERNNRADALANEGMEKIRS